jgi:hypothetical protein
VLTADSVPTNNLLRLFLYAIGYGLEAVDVMMRNNYWIFNT